MDPRGDSWTPVGLGGLNSWSSYAMHGIPADCIESIDSMDSMDETEGPRATSFSVGDATNLSGNNDCDLMREFQIPYRF